MFSIDQNNCDVAGRSVVFRNIIGFWILGVANFYSCQTLLIAAHDILNREFLNPTSENISISYPLTYNNNISNHSASTIQCNALSTGVVLLVEILPQLLMKLILPFFNVNPSFIISLMVGIFIGSLLLIGFSFAEWTTFLSILCIGVAASLGENTFLRFSGGVFGKKEMLAWAAGTGGGTVFSSLAYTSLTSAGLSTQKILHITILIPILMLISYWCILVRPKILTSEPQLIKVQTRKYDTFQIYDGVHLEQYINKEISIKNSHLVHLNKRKKAFMVTLPYATSLSIVYFAEYFINMGLYELIYFPGIWLQQSEQYRWFITAYQITVFLSRSLASLIMCCKNWILPVLQVLNIAIFLLEVFFKFIPSFWIMLLLICYEGMLGGAAYVIALRKVLEKINPAEQDFALSLVAISDTLGVCLSGFVALPVHDYICKQLK